MGHRGDSLLEIYILGIFGGISSNFSLDSCQKPPKKLLTLPGARGASYFGGQLGVPVFLKSAFLVFLVLILLDF